MASDSIDRHRGSAWVSEIGRNVLTWAVVIPAVVWWMWSVAGWTEAQPPQFAVSKLVMHAATINALAFSPDGRTLASGDYNGDVRVWDQATGREWLVLPTKIKIPSLAFSPDGRILAVAGWTDSRVRFWTLDRVEECSALDVGANQNVRVAFSPDGSLLAVLHGPTGTVGLWEYPSGRKRAVLRGPQQGFGDFAFSPDGKLLVTAGRDGQLRLWETSSGRETAGVDAHSGVVTAVAFSPDGSQVASAGLMDATVRLWGVNGGFARGTTIVIRRLVTSLAFPAADVLLVATPNDGGILSFDTANGRARSRQWVAIGSVRTTAVSSDGRQLATGGNDQTMRLWDLTRIVTDRKSD